MNIPPRITRISAAAALLSALLVGGTVFSNREGVLPGQSSGYYHEYTVVTPGSPTRGARRIVTGEQAQEDYYTSDHYATFDLVDFDC